MIELEIEDKIVQVKPHLTIQQYQRLKSNEEKFNIVETENKDLRKENKRLKTKNGLFNIISAAIIAPLTYLLIIK